MCGCFKCDWFSISRLSWCSTCAFCNCDLNSTFNATINFDFFSRARYTLPNLPLPSGLPMSKSESFHRRFGPAESPNPAAVSKHKRNQSEENWRNTGGGRSMSMPRTEKKNKKKGREKKQGMRTERLYRLCGRQTWRRELAQ